MNRKNMTKTILWPQPEAWNNFKLSDHLPGRLLDTVDKRTRALRVLAMYRWAAVAKPQWEERLQQRPRWLQDGRSYQQGGRAQAAGSCI
jgi:hypothetical protein